MDDGLDAATGTVEAAGGRDGPALERALRHALVDVGAYSRGLLRDHALRPYQVEVARAIAASVRGRRGLQFAIVSARQAGKDETLAQLLAYLLTAHWQTGGSIVVAAPTYRPQSLIARARLLDRLDNDLTRRLAPRPTTESGYIVRLGRATARFLSAGPQANVRGETASLLLVCNEAQDVDAERWDAVFDPMAAATNATTVFSGTVWSDRTLLARQMRHLRALERADGQQRVFMVPWTRVAADLPAYGERVRARIAQFGRDHPFIRTEYELQELAGAGGLFGAARQAQLRGEHPRQRRATPGALYALLLDVAGEDEGLAGARGRDTPRRDGADGGGDRAGAGRGAAELPGRRSAALDRHAAHRAPRHHRGPRAQRLAGARARDRRDGRRRGPRLLAHRCPPRSRHAVGLHRALEERSRLAFAGRDRWWALEGVRRRWRGRDATLLAATRRLRVRGAPRTRQAPRLGMEDPRVHDDLLLSLALVGALDDLDWRPRVARRTVGDEWASGLVDKKGRGTGSPQRRRDAEDEKRDKREKKGTEQEA